MLSILGEAESKRDAINSSSHENPQRRSEVSKQALHFHQNKSSYIKKEKLKEHIDVKLTSLLQVVSKFQFMSLKKLNHKMQRILCRLL